MKLSASVVSAVASALAVMVLTALLRQLAKLTREVHTYMLEQKWVVQVALWATVSVTRIMAELGIDGPAPPPRPEVRKR